MALEVNAENINALRALLRRIPAGERETLFGAGNGGNPGASSGSTASGSKTGAADSSKKSGDQEPSLFMVVWPNKSQGASGSLNSDGSKEIEGEAPDDHLTEKLQDDYTKHHGIALSSWSWGVDSPATNTEGGNWSVAAPVPRELEVQFGFDAASPKLLQEVLEGRALAALSILCTKSVTAPDGGDADGKSDYYLLVKIYDAWINSINFGGSKEGVPNVTMNLSFWNIEFRYRKSLKGGKLDYSGDIYYQWYPQAGYAGYQAEDVVVNRFEKTSSA